MLPFVWRLRLRYGLIGVALGAVALGAAALYVRWFGPLFGAWDWRGKALAVLVFVTLVLITLASTRGDQNPYTRLSPGGPAGPGGAAPLGIQHGQALDPQIPYGGTRAPTEPDAYASGDNRWFWIALPPSAATFALLLLVW